MRKLFTLMLITMLSGSVFTQTKIAYVRIDDIVGLMPELSPQKINMDTIGQQYLKGYRENCIDCCALVITLERHHF